MVAGQWVYVERREPEGPSEVFSLRIPSAALARLRAIADERGEGHTSLARAWLLDRLAAEAQLAEHPSVAAEPAPPYVIGADPMSWLRSRLGDVASLCRSHGVTRLGAFGSVTTGRFDPARSDVDIAVVLHRAAPAVRADRFFSLHEELERRIGRSVDLVELAAVKDRAMRSAIEDSLVPLHGRS